MMEWQPIETAPRSGEFFLGYAPGLYVPYVVAFFDDDYGTFRSSNNGTVSVTAWARLIEPPEAE